MASKGVDIDAVMERLEAQFTGWVAEAATDGKGPAVLAFVAQHESDPFRVLVSCILSLRTLDQVTAPISQRLFALADTPETIAALGVERLTELIYPVAFYKTKAPRIIAIAERLLRDFGGQVPTELDTLLTFEGVGRKTANLVLVEGHHLPGICVDTHVHRISNRLGYVRTRTPDETELRLRRKLPKRHWMRINLLMVAHGQVICRPISPRCSECPLGDGLCRRVGVEISR